MNPNEDPELNVKEIVDMFKKEQQVQSHTYGWAYPVEIKEEDYRNYTYHSTQSLTQPTLTFRVRDNQDRTVETGKTANQYKARNYVSSSSPYDFHGLVEPAIEWSLLCTFEAPVLNDAQLKTSFKEEDICFRGKAKVFDTRVLSTRPTKKLPLPAVTAKDEPSILTDPVIVDLQTKPMAEGAQMRVFTSVKCLAAISVCNRSVCPFELVFDKKDKDLYVYPRTKNSPAISESTYETITVANSNRREDASSDFLANLQESCNIQAQFTAIANAGQTPEFRLGEDIKFPDAEDYNGAFVYRRFVIGQIEYIVRCEIDCLRQAIEDQDDEDERPQIAICRTFNSLPTDLERHVNWAVDLEKQRSSLLLAEVKDNSNTFARWTAIGRLMNCAQIFLGFAERKVRNNNMNHVILSAERQAYPRSATMISLTEKSMMGMINLIFSKLLSQDQGIYHFQRDPRKRCAKIYKE